jgi:hypothetical protein
MVQAVVRPQEFYALNPTEFEHRVGEILSRNGYRSVLHAGRSGDHGIDLRCQDKRSRRVVVQCKLYVRGHNVGEDAIRNLLGSMHVDGAEKAIFVTSSNFTIPARDVATRAGMMLVNGDELAAMDTNLPLPRIVTLMGPWLRSLGRTIVARPRASIVTGLFLVALVALGHPSSAGTTPAQPAISASVAQATHAGQEVVAPQTSPIQRGNPPIAIDGSATLALAPTTVAESPTALPSFLVSIAKNAGGDFVIKGTGFQPNEALTVHMSRYNGSQCVSSDGTACTWTRQADVNGDYLRITPLDAVTTNGPHLYWIIGSQGDETNHVVVMVPKNSFTEPMPADETIITIIGSSPRRFHVHSAGYLPNEPLTVRLGADRAPNCQVDGGPCIWHGMADAKGIYDRMNDFSHVNGLGKYWMSISGDTSARTGTTSFQLGALLP